MIYFVGAGPGAADLITVRGKRLLEEADVILYAGSLVNPELLSFAKPEARIYNSAFMTLEEVLDVMRSWDARGKDIVRLHTGEPSLYGAVREQMDLLEKEGIAFSSCPGVSACFGAAAALDMEYTLPDVSQTLIITRMEGRTKVPAAERMEELARHRASMAVYLSAGFLDRLQESLIRGGYPPETGAAIVYRATWPDERKYLCTVGTLASCGREHQITKTAVILVGDAVTHASFTRSRLYDPAFSTGFRPARRPAEGDAGQIIAEGEAGPDPGKPYIVPDFRGEKP